MRRAAVILWDVDGTLISCGGAGRRALERALAERCGPLDGALAGLRLDGMTDRLIVREALSLLAHPFSDDACDGVLARYLEHLAVEIRNPGYQVLPGVEAALRALRGRVPQGLCTGNVAEGARVKLAQGGLDAYFDWGPGAICGFAADGEAREHVVAAAVRRASARLGRTLDPAEALVVGDTPRDVAAAHRVGCPVLAVATGRYSADELAASGADQVIASLEDAAALGALAG
ncbi:HAD family hydrolase [Anaeromyxobacter dehalogenans]|uniref:phosphoglycolate phosphatase n=1 Tax=Anaeromyxobacter dehalogenans (strain 2CP-C) TaxID=290397 RepID=Q2INR9_ANADE|nr:HAD family hydrolase [Anaeromyxobacter dehalogenans]ABC80448.1 Haloacid dehalogenase-like hydrolase [Anaeromyxobacter dehalogenans 2CP-C]